jgi:hypothetical protein
MMRPRTVKVVALLLTFMAAIGVLLGIDVISGGLITDSIEIHHLSDDLSER